MFLGKQPRGIEDQKSSQEKIKIRTLRTVGCGTRLNRRGCQSRRHPSCHVQRGLPKIWRRANRKRMRLKKKQWPFEAPLRGSE